VLKEGKVYVSKDRKWKITELVIGNYWWPGVMKDVEGYDICQRMKNRMEILARKLKLSKVSEKP